MIECSLLICAVRLEINGRSVAGHGGELLPGDKPPALPKRDQLSDPVTVTGDDEGLPVLDRVHDLPRPDAQISLGDLGTSVHPMKVASRAIQCYQVRAGAVPLGGGHGG
jgi:hypothetical protein